MNPLARSIEELLPERISENIWCFILLRTALVASSVCSAFLLPFFGKNIKLERSRTHVLNGLKTNFWFFFCCKFVISHTGLVMALIGSLLSILVVSFHHLSFPYTLNILRTLFLSRFRHTFLDQNSNVLLHKCLLFRQ